MGEPSWRERGFPGMTGLGEARDRLLAAVEPLSRTVQCRTRDADGRVLATAVAADRDVPHYRRAAMDGFAVRAADTRDATAAEPVGLRLVEEPVERGTAARVQTGEPLPAGADAVVRIERTDLGDGTLAVHESVAEGKDVAPVGEDVTAGQPLFEPGHRLRPSDLGLLVSVGRDAVTVVPEPAVTVVPTGDELVHGTPAPGEVVETNGLTLCRYVERWGGTPTRRDPLPDAIDAVAAAIEAEADADAVVTIGGSSVGDRDVVPAAIETAGELLVHGVAIKPGHPVALGRVNDTPVLGLPGYPVSAIVTAVQFLRPVLGILGRRDPPPHPRQRATLSVSIESDASLTAFERVRVEETDGSPVATPVEAAGAGVLSSVALAHGWVVVPEGTASLRAESSVDVVDWEPPQ